MYKLCPLPSIAVTLFNHSGPCPDEKLAIVIGLTSIVIEILENNVEVIHICPEPKFECYNELFWPNIKMKQFSQYTYAYRLIKYGRCLKLGNRENMLKKY